jgi:two-component system sensor histidine kinase DctS
MNAVVREAVDLLRRSLGKSGIGLDKQLASGLPQVLADRVGIEQVIMNLVRNAADALRDRDQDRRIRVCTELVDGAVHLEVSDNGPGLQGRTIETLCASFYSTKEDGMGMGLAICRSIIEAHQGSFSASEVPAGGASFRFSVPVGSASQTRMTA